MKLLTKSLLDLFPAKSSFSVAFEQELSLIALILGTNPNFKIKKFPNIRF